MSNIVKYVELRNRLDEIDKQVYLDVRDGFYESRLKIKIGLWEKGKTVCDFRGVNPQTNWLQLEKQTGRNHESLKAWHDLYQKYLDKKKYIEEVAKPASLKWAEDRLKSGNLLSSDSPEWWTPKKYIDAAREVMGGIDLDPASCAEANKIVQATQFYDEEINGLNKIWEGRVFLNPPYGLGGPEFIEKFIHDIESTFNEGIILVNSRSTDADWFQPMFNGIICFTDHRIDFDSPGEKKTSSTHGSCFIYFGPNEKKFAEIFAQFGNIVKRWPSE